MIIYPVFIIKYLRSLGFDITNDTFAKNAWYFRNALVRANYKNLRKNIFENRSFLIKFLRNLLLNENNLLENKELHISYVPLKKDDSREHRIISLIKNNPHIKLEDIANELGVSLRTVKSLIAALTQNNKIVRVDGKKYGYWKINE